MQMHLFKTCTHLNLSASEISTSSATQQRWMELSLWFSRDRKKKYLQNLSRLLFWGLYWESFLLQKKCIIQIPFWAAKTIFIATLKKVYIHAFPLFCYCSPLYLCLEDYTKGLSQFDGDVNSFTPKPLFIIAIIKSMSNHLLGAPVCKLPMNVPMTITE